MPTIKLTAGTLLLDGERFVAGDVLDVTDRLASKLDCEIVEPPKPEPEHDIEDLRKQCMLKGIEYKKQWSIEKLLRELDAHGEPDRS